MSRSRRAAQGEASPAPRQRGSIWTAGNGRIRTGWLLAASLFLYALAAAATRYGLVRAFGALFRAWGVDDGIIHLAPAWARAVYVWHGSFATLTFAAVTLLLVRWLRRLWGLEARFAEAPKGRLWRSALLGAAAAIAVAALCLLPDSVRLQWPLSAPRLTWRLPILAALSLAAAFAEEAFTKRVLYDGLSGRWKGIWVTAVVCAVFWLANGGYAGGVVGALNVLLLGWMGCMLYARFGLWASVGFRWGWSLVNVFLLGFGGGETAVYRLYGVSEGLLTGGDAGPMFGLWATMTLAGLILAVTLKRK